MILNLFLIQKIPLHIAEKKNEVGIDDINVFENEKKDLNDVFLR